jgi:hypothetical protein
MKESHFRIPQYLLIDKHRRTRAWGRGAKNKRHVQQGRKNRGRREKRDRM